MLETQRPHHMVVLAKYYSVIFERRLHYRNVIGYATIMLSVQIASQGDAFLTHGNEDRDLAEFSIKIRHMNKSSAIQSRHAPALPE